VGFGGLQSVASAKKGLALPTRSFSAVGFLQKGPVLPSAFGRGAVDAETLVPIHDV